MKEEGAIKEIQPASGDCRHPFGRFQTPASLALAECAFAELYGREMPTTRIGSAAT